MNAEEENQVSVRPIDESGNFANVNPEPDSTGIEEEEEDEKDQGPVPSPPPPRTSPAGAKQGRKPLKTRPVSKKVEDCKKRAASEALDQTDDTSAGDPGQSGDNERSTRPRKRTVKTDEAESGESGDAEDEEAVSSTPATKKRRKAPKSTTGQKGNWSTEEDNLIIHLKKEGKGWQDITNLINVTGGPGNERTLTAVRLRYQKVLKDRDTELTNEEFLFLKQAEAEVTKMDKYSLVVKRYKELSGKDLTKLGWQKFLALAKKNEPSVTKHGKE
ncbi:hypothetical protein DFP73DRAFT_584719 [Morchella snyderi]|nr:hypothetical protein DFP73DRAFT_584719 [Morchella snyderi]